MKIQKILILSQNKMEMKIELSVTLLSNKQKTIRIVDGIKTNSSENQITFFEYILITMKNHKIVILSQNKMEMKIEMDMTLLCNKQKMI